MDYTVPAGSDEVLIIQFRQWHKMGVHHRLSLLLQSSNWRYARVLR
jgi:hypothetical protein